MLAASGTKFIVPGSTNPNHAIAIPTGTVANASARYNLAQLDTTLTTPFPAADADALRALAPMHTLGMMSNASASLPPEIVKRTVSSTKLLANASANLSGRRANRLTESQLSSTGTHAIVNATAALTAVLTSTSTLKHVNANADQGSKMASGKRIQTVFLTQSLASSNALLKFASFSMNTGTLNSALADA